ncbi:MAG: endopeptidase La [Saprospiraceae bacterium]|nr:endopeptidase La [Saprospiraceae bacterium]MBK9223112.1 endopeptidase La [Saprospiraceae bacterium]MBK9720642.1 endopeptidase La [Saprospiraceae bacterium]MBK9727631.1 endopeptidase La [Saprospiraceae bacterium]
MNFNNIIFDSNLHEDEELLPFVAVADDEEPTREDHFSDILPVMPLKNTVLFPGVIIPITVGRNKSIRAVTKSQDGEKYIIVLTQKDHKTEDPGFNDMYTTGTVARIVKLLKMPDGSQTVILQGRKRCLVEEWTKEEPYLEARIVKRTHINSGKKLEYEVMIKTIQEKSRLIVELSPQIPNEAQVLLRNINNDRFLLHFISSNLNIPIEQKQLLLEMDDLHKKAETLLVHLENELQLLEVKDQIESKVRTDLEKQQRDYFLNQQLKTIQEELGQDPQEQDIEDLKTKAATKKWNKSIQEHFDKELSKLKRMNPQVAEYSVQMNYLDLLVDLPWNEYTQDTSDLNESKKILEQDHNGLEKIKERILEHLAVLKLKGDMKAPILCLVGPPGVGKTSLGKSIAKALDRKFIRMSLGGLHDESEIRGHRKTYIGAMPGRIIQSIRKAKSANPVFILDEIDKIGKDFRGDPSSALLEVLDPEQNSSFHDNYLDLEFDLSKILFIATANSLSTIQPALLDRMEIIELQGYSTEEKIEIAKDHLIPSQITEHGLKSNQIKLSDEVLERIIQDYTRESGVRTLNRQLASVMRKAASKIAMEKKKNYTVKSNDLKDILGIPRFNNDNYQENLSSGVAIGLAWTRVGGDILYIETSLSKGKGKMVLTGNLGDVMKESASTALSYIKAHSDELQIDADFFENTDIHIHVPEGAIPKDGPSAGITMLSSMCSAIKKKPIKPFLAMTGEITLRGKVLPVGGIKEKILAAKRAGIQTIILCKDNKAHVEEVNPDHLKGMEFIYVKQMNEVLQHALNITSF